MKPTSYIRRIVRWCEDRDGISHTFQFRTHVFSDQLSLEALETGPQEGYEFSVIADAEQDLFVTNTVRHTNCLFS
jgi:hypothetical protein